MTKKITIEKLAEITQRGFIDVEKRLDERMDKGFTEIKETMKEMVTELTATHADVRHIKGTTDVLVRSDAAQDAAIKDLTARVQRPERKVS